MGLFGDLSPQGSIAVGVLVGLISTSLQAIGLTLQRKSHMLEDEKHPYDLRRPPYKRRRWQVGMLMFVVSNVVGSTIQITTLPLPVLSTLQASGLVFNTIFATLILGEPFTRYSLFGTVLVCIGAVLIATFGAIGEPAHSLDQLLELLERRRFVLWMVGTAIIMLVILLGSRLLKFLAVPSRSRHGSSILLVRFPVLHQMQMSSGRVKLIRGMCFGLVSGILSAHTLLLAKSAVELLVRTVVDHANQFNRWQSWMIVAGMVLLALSQLFYLHRGLKLCSTSVLYPFVFCIYNIIAILDGLIYFRQASQLAGLHAGLIALGTVILLSGVLCLSWRLDDLSHDAHGVGVSKAGAAAAAAAGIGVGDESVQSPLGLAGPNDEEAFLGREYDRDHERREHEPLLSHLRRFPHRRAPSLPLMGPPLPYPDPGSAVSPASIWAELDDSDEEGEDEGYRSVRHSPGSRRPLSDHHHQQQQQHVSHRPRSQSGTQSELFALKRRPARRGSVAAFAGGFLRHSIAGNEHSFRRYGTWDSRRGGGGGSSSSTNKNNNNNSSNNNNNTGDTATTTTNTTTTTLPSLWRQSSPQFSPAGSPPDPRHGYVGVNGGVPATHSSRRARRRPFWSSFLSDSQSPRAMAPTVEPGEEEEEAAAAHPHHYETLGYASDASGPSNLLAGSRGGDSRNTATSLGGFGWVRGVRDVLLRPWTDTSRRRSVRQDGGEDGEVEDEEDREDQGRRGRPGEDGLH